MDLPSFPKDSQAQEIGRRGEAHARELFERHGWIVMRNTDVPDFGVDLGIYRRTDDRRVLPFALSVQVKASASAVGADERGGVAVQVPTHSFASWLWSSTPTVCLYIALDSGTTWWGSPEISVGVRQGTDTKTRAIFLRHTLANDRDWQHFAWAVDRMWASHAGASCLDDVPLVIQLLTSVALETNLWRNAEGTSEAIYRAAATHVFRVVSSLNALAGRVGGSAYLAVPQRDAGETSMSWVSSLVTRGDIELGILRYMISTTDSKFLLDVFGACGSEFREDIERLRLLAGLPELGVSDTVRQVLAAIDDRLLAVIDPALAAHLQRGDFNQDRTSDFDRVSEGIEYDLRGYSPLARQLPEVDLMRDDPRTTLL